MGIDYSAKFIYGTDYDSLVEALGEDELNEMIDNGELETASPYYDSPVSDRFIGIEMRGEYEDPVDMMIAGELAKARFRKIVGPNVEAVFEVRPDVY